MIARLARVSDRWQLYRDTTTGWVAGVCAGIGLRLGIRPLWIRLGFTALALSTKIFPALAVYLLLTLVLKLRLGETAYLATPMFNRSSGKARPRPAAGPDMMAGGSLGDLGARFAVLNRRLNRIEAAVTSEELSLRRKFRDLGA